MERKFYLLVAIAVILIVSGGIYAYTYTTATGTIGTPTPTGDIATVNATGTQPNWSSILTPVNNDVILRPIGTGDETEVKSQYPATGDHWDKVDEAASDDDGTYIYTPTTSYEEDLYNTANHSTQTAGGDIQYVEVFMESRSSVNSTQESAYVHIKTNGVEYNGPSENLSANYTQYSESWNTNPQSASTWTWNEIDTLQTGVGMRKAGVGIDSLCTQVYTEVSFDAPTLTGSTPTGDLFEVTPHANYSGNLQVRTYLTNTDSLQKAYGNLTMELYLEDSVETGETPNYQLMTLENGVATFNLVDIIYPFRQWQHLPACLP